MGTRTLLQYWEGAFRPAYRTCGERVAPTARLLLPGAQEGYYHPYVSVWLAGGSVRGVDLEDSEQ